MGCKQGVRILIVDDDIEMLESLCAMVRAHPFDYELAGAAESGTEALRALRSTKVDIVVTDITMPDMDGLALISAAKKEFNDLHFLLITCHEEFEYARQGITLGIDDYLVKYTLTDKIFVNALDTVRARILKQRSQKKSIRRLFGEVYKNREHFKEGLVKNLFAGRGVDAPALAEQAGLYDVALPPNTVYIAGAYSVMPVQMPLAKQQMIQYAIMNMVQELASFSTTLPFIYGENIYLLFWEKAGHGVWLHKMKEALERVRMYTLQYFGVEIAAVIATKPYPINQLSQSIDRLNALVECSFYLGGIQLEENLLATHFLDSPVAPDKIAALQRRLFDTGAFRDAFATVCEEIVQAQYSPAHVYIFLEDVVTQLQMASKYSGNSIARIAVTGKTMAACRQQVEAMISLTAHFRFCNQKQGLSADIRTVIEYVNANLSTEISLESAANLVYKNSSYLSRQFKKETGLTFSEFLIRQRVQKATYLLSQTDLPVEDIGAAVGIQNSQYFYTFFKRETGLTPGELRK